MSAVVVALVAVAGGIGAAGRFLLDGVIRGLRQSPLPLGTLTINVTGSLILGVITGVASHLDPVIVAAAGTGLLGGYTTFSTASVETLRLARAGRTGLAAVNGLGMLAAAVAASILGVQLGAWA